MRKDRDVMPYPIYPPYQGIGQMPFMPMPNMVNPYFMSNTTCSSQSTTQNSDINILEQKVTNLEKRVSTLESMINSSNSISNNYNSSNYQML